VPIAPAGEQRFAGQLSDDLLRIIHCVLLHYHQKPINRGDVTQSRIYGSLGW
jgi:hypothetical protein